MKLYDRPRNRFVAGFIGSPSMNMIDCRLEATDAGGAGIVLADGVRLLIPVDARNHPVGGTMTLGIRPEHLHAGSGDDALRATVIAVERLGNESLVHARLRTGEILTWRGPATPT